MREFNWGNKIHTGVLGHSEQKWPFERWECCVLWNASGGHLGCRNFLTAEFLSSRFALSRSRFMATEATPSALCVECNTAVRPITKRHSAKQIPCDGQSRFDVRRFKRTTKKKKGNKRPKKKKKKKNQKNKAHKPPKKKKKKQRKTCLLWPWRTRQNKPIQFVFFSSFQSPKRSVKLHDGSFGYAEVITIKV